MQVSSVSVSIGGQAITHTLVKVEVTQEINQHWWASVECSEMPGTPIPMDTWIGQDLKIVAYDAGGVTNVLFDGFVLEAELGFEIAGGHHAWVTGVTRSYRLDLTARQAYYENKDLPYIAGALTTLDGVDLTACQTSLHPSLHYVQWGETDFRFLLRLADDCGGWIRPSAGGIEIYDSFQGQTQLEWRTSPTNDELLNFRIKGRTAAVKQTGFHYDPAQMQSMAHQKVTDPAAFFDGSGKVVDAVKKSNDTLPEAYVCDRDRAPLDAQYEAKLKRESVRAEGAGVTGWGESRGVGLRPGMELKIQGQPDAQGSYGLTKVIHRWKPQGGYRNKFWCTPWKNYRNPQTPEVRRWWGLVPARVVDHNDTANLGRLKVRYIWQQGGDQTYWARMMTPHAGQNRGFLFLPEVGDEVVVAFEDGDPERPVILGCLWNGQDPAPRQDFWTADDVVANKVKRIVTKSGVRIQMADTANQESLVLATPRDLKISLIEKTAETGRPMILLHAETGDLFLSAPNGRIHFHSKYFSREVG